MFIVFFMLQIPTPTCAMSLRTCDGARVVPISTRLPVLLVARAELIATIDVMVRD